jgi:hypothetical protein
MPRLVAEKSHYYPTPRFVRGIFDFFKKIFCLSHPGLIFLFMKKAF